MWTNYLKIALRNFRRQTFFSLINITGLGVGLAACWLIGLFVVHEQSYDRFLPDADRICAVALDLKMGDMEGRTTNTPPPLGPRLAADYPDIELAARSFDLGDVVVRREQSGHAPLVFTENTAMAVDTAYLELFGFPMVEGDASSALDAPGSLVMSETAAEKYFGKTAALGQSLLLNDRIFKVTGIVKNLPSTSTVQFDFLLPMANFRVVENFAWSWIWLQVDTWVKLRKTPETGDIAALESKFPAMVRAYAPAAYERIGQNLLDNLKKGDRLDVDLIPLRSLHLDAGELASRLTTLGDRQQVRIFSIVGALILLLACVNFMNLSTARSMRRAREVGVRKALGSQRSALAGQFLTEALMYGVAAMVFAGIFVGLSLPYFNQLTELELNTSDLFSSQVLALVAALPLLAGLTGGLYPALYLSKFKTTDIFKSARGTSKGGHSGIRSTLVVFQFAVSIALMFGSYVVYRQLEFARKQSPGLQREHVLMLPGARHLESPLARESFRQQLLQLPEAVDATWSTFLPSTGSFGDYYEPELGHEAGASRQQYEAGTSTSLSYQTSRQQYESKTVPLLLSSFLTDVNFVPTLGIEIIAGRNFQSNTGADSTSVILNESAVKAFGWNGDPIGRWMRYPGNENQRFQVVGVMRDFHMGSVKNLIEPAALFHETSKTYQTWGSYIALRLKAGTEKEAIAKVGALWKATVPGAPFEYDFLDASFARLYQQEAKTSAVLGVFTGLALFIGCLGLFALATFMAEQRTKEIGIRKVLGASVAGITGLLARDFLKLVLIAIAIATPLAWYFMQNWLADFAYRIELQWWMVVLAGSVAVLIAFFTVSFQSVKAALANPVKSLKSE